MCTATCFAIHCCSIVCPYHGWTYDSAGKNLDVRDRKHGQYSPVFDRDSHDLAPIAHFGNYRGFLFGTLNPDAATLDAYLGDTRFFLDLVIDQSPHGIELVPGSSTYTFNGNWKLQIENCVDVYHVLSAHSSFVKIDKTEMRIYCLAPVGEPDDARAFRIRQCEDFFNVSGLATPDETIFHASYREWLRLMKAGEMRNAVGTQR